MHGLIAAGVDITEREASDERFRILFERSSDAHLLLDDTGVIDCNDATLRLLRCVRKSEVLGRSTAELSPTRQPDGRLSVVVAAQMLQRARDHGFYRFEWTHQRSDGSIFPVETTLTPVRLNGREVILAVWHDIAEQKKVEHALRTAKDAAESANRTKSEFMTRMNHELRTPLTAIIGFSRVLLAGKEGPLTANAQLYAERIRANGMHLLSLINQILDVAKVEAGRMELETETVAVDALVRDTMAMLESTAHAKGIALHSHVPAVVAPIVTDAGKLKQILINLIGNAIKFTNEGEVSVAVEVDAAIEPPRVDQRARHGHRHRPRPAAEGVRALRAGRQLDAPRVRWNGAGARHREGVLGADRRRDRGGERAGTRNDLHGMAADRRAGGHGLGRTVGRRIGRRLVSRRPDAAAPPASENRDHR